MKKLAQFVALVLLVTPALAQSRIYQEGGNWAQELSGSIGAARNLQVQVDACSVRIEGGSQPGISYVMHNRAYTSSEDRARRQFESYKLTASTHGDTVVIEGEWENGSPRKFSGDLVINVPRDLAGVKIETSGGSVTTRGIAGSVDAETGGGRVQMEDIGGSVRASTGGDNIEIGTVGGDVSVETGGGRVSLGNVRGKINASTGGGDVVLVSGQQGAILQAGGGNIQVKQVAGRLKISTGGGNIDIGDVSGPVELETGGGSIRLGSARGPVRAETGAGRIELNGVPSARVETGAGGIVAKFVPGSGSENSSLETSAGDITVYLSSKMNLTIRAAIEMANGHHIHSDIPEIKVTSEGWPVGAADHYRRRHHERRRSGAEGADEYRRHLVPPGE